ncbi:MAG: carbohydrate binding family 9 domain-containing protein [Gemmatimonadales bacterium]|nr:carbohydrate binding family 9 domain-containing protein [Gemmatimonadales bacterium]
MLLALLLFQDPQLPPPTVTVPRIEATITVDGELDEPVWQRAVRLDGFRQYRPVDGRPAEERTEVLVWYGPDAIHFGVLAYDREPGSIRATVADRDRIGNDDNVTIYLDTFNDRRRAFVFGVNPLGIQEDGVLSEGTGGGAGALFGGGLDRSPDFIFQSQGRLTDQGFVVEIRIPFKSLRYPGSGPQAWGLNVSRIVRRTGYEDTWSDVRRANASFLAQSGRLEGLYDLRSGVTTEVQPYLSGIAEGSRQDDGTWEAGELRPDAGVNLRLSRNNLALDATLNPDFSQVLPDVGLVTVNERFALFIPEQREFFLEGIDLFATPNQLVYTRQVVDPFVGAKFTGKVGRTGLAWLGALDQSPDPDALFNIARGRYDIGANSLLAATVTSREADGSYNRVVAADSRIVFGRIYFAQAQLGQSWTRDDDGTRDGPLWQAEVDRTGRAWGFNVQVNGIAPGFETQAGFVPRTNIISGRLFNRLTVYGARGAAVEQVSFFLAPRRIWEYERRIGDGGPIEGVDRVSVDARLRGNWNLGAAAERTFFTFDPADTDGLTVGAPDGPVFVPARGTGSLWGGSLSLTTPVWRQLDAAFGAGWIEVPIFGEAGTGAQWRATANVGLRPTRSVRIVMAGTWTRIVRDAGDEYATTLLPRLTLEIQPVRQVFFRLFAEYRDDRRDTLQDPATGLPLYDGSEPAGASAFRGVRTDVLLQYLPSPGTVAYIGYGANLDDQAPSADATWSRSADRFFVKVAYFFRR